MKKFKSRKLLAIIIALTISTIELHLHNISNSDWKSLVLNLFMTYVLGQAAQNTLITKFQKNEENNS